MKKHRYLIIFSLIFPLILTGCGQTSLSEESESSLDPNIITSVADEQKTWNLEVRFDYGFHVEDTLTMLYNDIIPFFNTEQYGITDLLAGDILTIRYTGEIRIQETYPATIGPSEFTITDVSIIRAKVVRLAFYEQKDYYTNFITVDGSAKIYRVNFPYIIYPDNTFSAFDDTNLGRAYYGTLRGDMNTSEVSALYTTNRGRELI